MFIVLLKFSDNKSQTATFMAEHNEWLKRGFDDGVFVMAGTIQPKQGGCIIAHGILREDLLARVDEDPFVRENVVSAEVLDIPPAKTDKRLSFLLGEN